MRAALSVTMAAGLVVTAGTGLARAERLLLPDVSQSSNTVDGWRFTLTMTELRVDAVPNLATSQFAKEGFVTAKATATVEGDGAVSVDSGYLVLGVQMGCQTDVSEGLELGFDPDLDSFDFNSSDIIDFNILPEINTKLKAGNITVIGLGAKPMKSRTATIAVRDAHVQVSECAGPVTIRMFASAKISTDSSDDSLNAYGAASAL
ncbi:MspA protein [Mycolicibacterium neoaurum]|uniref:MspA family porin n=1 Tax=Mycolicibacterium neoaurum TaxID=1795 RepID=UPI00068F4559|nr:MspA family porin [Mycolicibacterium neoaurum]SDD44085.1 MspA protein [Mycolicibacterium neoaurum]